MAHGRVSAIIPAPSAAVFDLLHDYDRRLEWDTLLQAAYLDDGWTVAATGATAVCVGRPALGGIALKTVYVSFARPKLAAVKMVNAPPLFATWAASIRHEDRADGHSTLTYAFNFTARPRWCRAVLEPVLRLLFLWETRRRLRALAAHFRTASR
jgi:hypothetical protein